MQAEQTNPLHNMQTMDAMRQRYATNHPPPSSKFVIEKDIPLPGKFAARTELPKNREARMLLSRMSVGDSVFFTMPEDFKTFHYAIGKLKKREGKRYATRKISDGEAIPGWRIWRIK